MKEYNFKCTTLKKYEEKMGITGFIFDLVAFANTLKEAKEYIRKKFEVRILEINYIKEL